MNFTYHKKRHDKLAAFVHHKILVAAGWKSKTPWRAHKPERTTVVGKHVVKWDPRVRTIDYVKHNHPDIIWESPDAVRIIEVSCPSDGKVTYWQKEKVSIYTDLQNDMRRTHRKPVTITPVVIGNTGVIASDCAKCLEDLNIELDVVSLQKIAAIETVKICRNLII